MNDKELDELLEYNQEYMDAILSEDVFGGDYTSEVELKYLQKDYDKLQSNWNSLREFVTLKEKPKVFGAKNGKTLELAMEFVFDMVLDKMNELESGEK